MQEVTRGPAEPNREWEKDEKERRLVELEGSLLRSLPLLSGPCLLARSRADIHTHTHTRA